MTPEEYQREVTGEFVPDERAIALHDRLRMYYRDTPDSMSNAAALPHWRLFKQWCEDRGYTQEEINRAKRSFNHE